MLKVGDPFSLSHILQNNKIIEKADLRDQRLRQDPDYEDEEEEEEEEEELQSDGEDNKTHSMFLQTANLFSVQFEEMIFQLLLEPLPDYTVPLKNCLSASFTNMDAIRTNALEVAGLKGDLMISSIPSPFTSAEGHDQWQNILNPKQISGKKPPAPKSQKGYANEDQRRKYYLHLYESLFNSLTEGIVQGLSEYDLDMNKLYEKNLREAGYSKTDQISTIRQVDILSTRPAFLVFNGEPFLSPPQPSAFDITTVLRLEAIAPILSLMQSGASTIILLSETFSDTTTSMNDIIQDLSELLTQKLLPNSKFSKNESIRDFTLKYIPSLAELNYYFDNLKKIPIQQFKAVTILILENLASSCLVPQPPPYREVLSDDEEDSIPLGVNEYKTQQREVWTSAQPNILPVTINIMGGSTTIQCYSDTAAALSNLVSTTNGIWIEGSLSLLSPPSSGTLEKCLFQNNFVSDEIKKLLVWFRVISLFPTIRTTRSSPKSDIQSLEDFISFLFPPENISDPSFVLTLGGLITTEKFRFLEKLLDLVSKPST